MSFTILSLCDRPVSLRLNTGVTRHLMPRGKIAGLREAEVQNNQMIEKLTARHLIALSSAPGGASETGAETSRSMSADDAIAHIRSAPAASLRGFTRGDRRKTVRAALETRMKENAG